jgi:hypothetical protein
MWPRTFDARLASWYKLRADCQNQPLHQALTAINFWWFDSPWCPYHLHWDDLTQWPDPWQLLEDNVFCDIARGLGMLYTIVLIDRPDLQNTRFVAATAHNLVLPPGEKYILNWDRSGVVNINLTLDNPRHSVDQQQLKQKIQ